MDGNEIIDRLKDVKKEILNGNLKQAMHKIDYIIDDIYMYKNNSL